MTKKAFFVYFILGVMLCNASVVLAGTIKGTVKYNAVKKSPALVYIVKVSGDKFSPTPAEMDQKRKTFIPKVLPVLAGSKVDFNNNDNIEHNIFSPEGKYDLGKWVKGTKSHTFNKEGVYTQLCKIHPEMIGYVVVLSNLYFGLTDEKGNFTIKNVPPGTYELKVWHERMKTKQLNKTFTVKVEGEVTDITITP